MIQIITIIKHCLLRINKIILFNTYSIDIIVLSFEIQNICDKLKLFIASIATFAKAMRTYNIHMRVINMDFIKFSNQKPVMKLFVNTVNTYKFEK